MLQPNRKSTQSHEKDIFVGRRESAVELVDGLDKKTNGWMKQERAAKNADSEPPEQRQVTACCRQTLASPECSS
jgi:hypothetical protein